MFLVCFCRILLIEFFLRKLRVMVFRLLYVRWWGVVWENCFYLGVNRVKCSDGFLGFFFCVFFLNSCFFREFMWCGEGLRYWVGEIVCVSWRRLSFLLVDCGDRVGWGRCKVVLYVCWVKNVLLVEEGGLRLECVRCFNL